MNRDQQIEQEIQAKKLAAPRVTLADLDANIASVEIHKHTTEGGQVLRWAIISTRSGFAVVGKPSVAVSPANDNAEIGEKVAIDNSRNELWPLMGYHLHQQLHEQQQALDSIGAPGNAAPHERRAAVELVELKTRVDKLGDFIDNSDTFLTLAPQQQLLMVRQHRAMTEYADALGARVLSTFTNENA